MYEKAEKYSRTCEKKDCDSLYVSGKEQFDGRCSNGRIERNGTVSGIKSEPESQLCLSGYIPLSFFR